MHCACSARFPTPIHTTHKLCKDQCLILLYLRLQCKWMTTSYCITCLCEFVCGSRFFYLIVCWKSVVLLEVWAIVLKIYQKLVYKWYQIYFCFICYHNPSSRYHDAIDSRAWFNNSSCELRDSDHVRRMIHHFSLSLSFSDDTLFARRVFWPLCWPCFHVPLFCHGLVTIASRRRACYTEGYDDVTG